MKTNDMTQIFTTNSDKKLITNIINLNNRYL